MKILKWEKGRQAACDYQKLCFAFFKLGRFGFDGYLLKYEPMTILPYHIDQISKGKHFRLNIVLKGASTSSFICERTIINWFSDAIVLFRPDLYKHSMVNGVNERVVLSIGFVI